MITFFIRKIREEKGLSQEQLARISGVSASHIGYIENGEREPTISILCKLAKALNVSLDELYEYKD